MDDLLDDLTPAQREAVTHYEGPLLILAGPGSGKTRVITRRVAWLLRQGVRPSNILAITFTNKAAGEMRQRIETLVPGCRVWISTFHSFGARLLRTYADEIGLERNFTIYDQNDRESLIKAAIESANLDNVRFTPRGMEAAISKAKNQLLTPDRYMSQARDFFQQAVAHVYPIYEKKLRDANAVDFDDLLLIPALALKNNAELRAELDERFRFILIDEYQDTNQAQYAIARRLSTDKPNLCVVGDPNQCLPPDTMIPTADGPRPIASLRDGDQVLSAIGWGDVKPMTVDRVMSRPYQGRLVKIRLEGGQVLRATPNHICFAKIRPAPSIHYTYLMYKQGVGYRIGTTRGVRVSTEGTRESGLHVRSNQEVADATWILRTCRSAAEARFYEHLLSVRYGIPTMVFFVRGRRMEMTQDWIDRLYQEIDTEAAGQRLMADFALDRRFPHHRPGGITRGLWARRHVLFTMFGDARSYLQRRWHDHRVQLVTTGTEMREAAAARFAVRDGSRGTWRIETSRKHYEDAEALAQEIGDFHEMETVSRARLTRDKAFPFMPASHIQPEMLVPVLEGEEIVEHRVESVEWEEYQGLVYDLSVPHTRNYVAEGLVVHNSIYRFRGSDIRNILDFETDFPEAHVIALDRNYRSTQAILDAASHLISHNKQRKAMHLTTENPAGQPVVLMTHESGKDEADSLVRQIRDMVQAKKRNYRDFAVFLRTNALSRALEEAFIKYGVRFQIVRGLAFFDRKENRDVLAYLRLLLNPRDDLSFQRAVNEPARGVGKVSLDHLKNYAETRELSLLEAAGQVERIPAIKGKAAAGLRDFTVLMRDLSQLRDAQPDEVIRQVLDRSGYRLMLKDSRQDEDRERLANIEELITAAQQFVAEDGQRTISDFLENITLASQVDSWDDNQDHVSVMTLHAAKGLEFAVVFMPALEQEIIPGERSQDKLDDIEEERRVVFVGMTRAKEELYLSHARIREFRGSARYALPSMFLTELPTDRIKLIDKSSGAVGSGAIQEWRSGGPAAEQGWEDAGVRPSAAPSGPGYAEGMLVKHDSYGVGRVTEVSGYGAMRRVKVRFSAHGEKTFVVDKVKLEVVRKA